MSKKHIDVYTGRKDSGETSPMTISPELAQYAQKLLREDEEKRLKRERRGSKARARG